MLAIYRLTLCVGAYTYATSQQNARENVRQQLKKQLNVSVGPVGSRASERPSSPGRTPAQGELVRHIHVPRINQLRQ